MIGVVRQPDDLLPLELEPEQHDLSVPRHGRVLHDLRQQSLQPVGVEDVARIEDQRHLPALDEGGGTGRAREAEVDAPTIALGCGLHDDFPRGGVHGGRGGRCRGRLRLGRLRGGWGGGFGARGRRRRAGCGGLGLLIEHHDTRRAGARADDVDRPAIVLAETADLPIFRDGEVHDGARLAAVDIL